MHFLFNSQKVIIVYKNMIWWYGHFHSKISLLTNTQISNYFDEFRLLISLIFNRMHLFENKNFNFMYNPLLSSNHYMQPHKKY